MENEIIPNNLHQNSNSLQLPLSETTIESKEHTGVHLSDDENEKNRTPISVATINPRPQPQAPTQTPKLILNEDEEVWDEQELKQRMEAIANNKENENKNGDEKNNNNKHRNRRSNQFEALLKGTENRNEFDVIEMDMSENTSAKKIMFDPSSHTAFYDPSTNMIIWSNGKKWVRKDFVPFRGRWRDPQGHVIAIEENGTITYIEPKDLGSYAAVVCGFYRIGINYANYTYTAKLQDKNVLKWDNGITWKRVDKPESCLIM